MIPLSHLLLVHWQPLPRYQNQLVLLLGNDRQGLRQVVGYQGLPSSCAMAMALTEPAGARRA